MSPGWTVLLLAASCLAVSSGVSGADAEREARMPEFYPSLPIVVRDASSAECRRDSALLASALDNHTYWAAQMWDASARESGGLINGNVFQFGEFDACLAARTPLQGGAQYCLVNLMLTVASSNVTNNRDIHDPEGPVWNLITRHSPLIRRRDEVYRGLCLPESCTAQEIQASLNSYLANHTRHDDVTVVATLDDADCHVATPFRLDAGALTFCLVVGALVLTLLAATLYDSMDRDDKEVGAWGYLLCFSMSRNFAALSVPEKDNRLHLLHGIKFMAMCGIMFDHRGCMLAIGANSNFSFVEWSYTQKYWMFIEQGDLLVDTFFLISGLMLAYVLLALPEKRPVNVLKLSALRYLRLTPAYALVIFFYAAVLNSIGDGPFWHQLIDKESSACSSNWWTNLLYINNYVNAEKLCMLQSWYLACDFHFFIVGLLLLLALRHDLWFGYGLYACALAWSVLSLLVGQYASDSPPVFRLTPEIYLEPRSIDIFRNVYIASHHRGVSYMVGLAVGYLLHRTREAKLPASWKPMLGICVAAVFLLGTPLGTVAMYDPDAGDDAPYNGAAAALITSLRRFSWSLGTAIFIVSLVFSKNSWMKRLLCWGPIMCLGKLVYCAYLMHMAVQIVDTSSTRDIIHVNYFTMFRVIIGDIVYTFLFSLGLHLIAEAPLRLLFKRLLSARPARAEQQDTSQTKQMAVT